MPNAVLFICLILFAATGQILLIWCLVAALKNLFRDPAETLPRRHIATGEPIR